MGMLTSRVAGEAKNLLTNPSGSFARRLSGHGDSFLGFHGYSSTSIHPSQASISRWVARRRNGSPTATGPNTIRHCSRSLPEASIKTGVEGMTLAALELLGDPL